jgi:hypothetical protein
MAKKKILNVYRFGVKADVVQADGVEGFAFYKVGSVKDNRCVIGLNVEAFVGCVAMKQIRLKDLPYVMAESIMHEVIHAIEDWAKVEFSHKKINKMLESYAEHYYGKNGVETKKRKKKS